jgi:tRNA (cmo5U34)-methyltransferase
MTPRKSTPQEIRERFDQDVERFSNLQTGQSATIDAPLVLDLITAAASATNPDATALLDVGCGAGNYTLKLLEKLPNLLNVTLIDLSKPMLERAVERVGKVASGGTTVTPMQGDVRELQLGEGTFDIIVAAAVLHHLRDDGEWESVFRKFHRALRQGGTLWISDLVTHEVEAVHALMWSRYGDYLKQLKNETYRDEVFAYIDREDTPRPVTWQLDLLQRVGFRSVELLHKNSCFAAFGAVK